MKNLIIPAQIVINTEEQFSQIEFCISYFLNEVESNLSENLDLNTLRKIEDGLIKIYEKIEVNMSEVHNIEEYGIHLTSLVNKLEDCTTELKELIEEFQITKLSIYLNS